MSTTASGEAQHGAHTPPRPYISPPTLDSRLIPTPSPSSSSPFTSTSSTTTPTHSLFSTTGTNGISPSSRSTHTSPSNAPVPSMLDLMAQFETSTTLRDSNETKPAWRPVWEDQDAAFQTEFDSELSFLCDRIHVQEEEDSVMKVGNMPYIL